MKNVLANLLNNKKLLSIIAILAVAIAVPLTVIISQQQQDLRQRAADETKDVSLVLAKKDSNTVTLELKSKNNRINGFDITIATEGIRLTGFTPEINVSQTLGIGDEHIIDGNKVRFWAVSSSPLDPNKIFQVNSTILLGTLSYETEGDISEYKISVEKAEITSPDKDPVLSYDSEQLTLAPITTPTPASSAVTTVAPSTPPPPTAGTSVPTQTAPTPGAGINLESAVIDESNSGANLIVNYSKNFDTCIHLLKTSNSPRQGFAGLLPATPTIAPTIIPTLIHSQNLFCKNQGPITVPFSKFTSAVESGMEVKLCNGNDKNSCSEPVKVSPAPIRLNTDGAFSVSRWGGNDKNIGLGNSVFVTIPVENYSLINDYRVVSQCFFERPSGIKTPLKGFEMVVKKQEKAGLQLFFQPPQNSQNNGEWKVTDCSIYQSFFQANKTVSEPIIGPFNPKKHNSNWDNAFTVTGK